MDYHDLKIGFFYWLKIYGSGMVARNVAAKIISINNGDDEVQTYKVVAISPINGKFMTLKACLAHEFVGEIDKESIKMIIEDINQRLEAFIEH